MKTLNKYSVHILVALFMATFFSNATSFAVSPSINANVYDGQPAIMTIESPTNDSTVNTSPMTVEGTVHNISQIMVYLDGVYSMTHPIDNGASTYLFQASVNTGTHVLKLIGINPYDGTTLEESVSFTYTPSSTPTPPAVEAVKEVAEKAQVSTEFLQEQVDQASVSEPAAIISDVAYEVLKTLDLVPTTSQQSMPQMLSRFGVVVTGVALILLTNPMITLYHLTRYQLMQWNVHALPELVRHHATFFLRIAGAVLLGVGFAI